MNSAPANSIAPSRHGYVVISPVRNEAKHFQRTINSMLAQSDPPREWIIVDDGSTDGTREMAEAAALACSWVRVVQRADRGFRKAGAGVVEAFYEGYQQLRCHDWNFVVKLDGDLEFEPHYFGEVTAQFAANPRLGITGGDIFHLENGTRVIESKGDPAFHVRGANKAYRHECWTEIAGLFSVTGWDTLDEVKANMLGWTTRRIPSLGMLHLKPTGAADGTWKDAFKNGRGSYIAGYHPLFLVARSLRKLSSGRSLIPALGLSAGYFTSYISQVSRVPDAQLVRYLRRQQLNRLRGKPSLWSSSTPDTSPVVVRYE